MLPAEQIVKCFPRFDKQPQPRDADSDHPKDWSPCRGAFDMRKSDALRAARGELTVKSNKRVVYRCPKREMKLDNHCQNWVWRCTYCCRRDRIRNDGHDHVFDCAPEYDSMSYREDEIRARAAEDRAEIYSARILKIQTRLMARLGLSFRKMESRAMFEATKGLVQIGIELQSGQEKGVFRLPEHFVKQFSRNTYAEELRKLFETERCYLADKYNTLAFGNIKIDAGTVCRSHCVHTLIDSPESGLPQWMHEAKENSGWTTDDYTMHLNTILDETE